MACSFLKLIVTVILIDMSAPHHHPEWWNEDFVTLIHMRQNGWKARISGYKSLHTETYIKGLFGQPMLDTHMATLRRRDGSSNDRYSAGGLPEAYDAGEKYPDCYGINYYLYPNHQGSCGSSWAISPTRAMTDKICINNISQNFTVSAEDLLTCCEECGFGCGGGSTSYAWEYWEKHGIVSGRDDSWMKWKRGCKPYTIPECTDADTCNGSWVTPPCTLHCYNYSDYNWYLYGSTRSYGHSIVKVEGEKQIKATIYYDGPVSATFIVHEDFFVYSSGVYFNVAGAQLGHHAVKLFGWGKENGFDYWWAQNTWDGPGKNGLFKILRGKNHCGIEDEVVSGEPLPFD